MKFFLLDNRYFLTPSDNLGPAQWDWLMKELRNSEAQINIIGGGVQFLGLEKPFENWGSHHCSVRIQLTRS